MKNKKLLISSSPKVFIDPRSNIPYSSYYIQGLYDYFGKKNVSFSATWFKDLDKNNEAWSYNSYMGFVITKEEQIYKIIIDFGDDVPIRENAYRWCDIYAKININSEVLKEEGKSKLLSIPPGFGIRIWSVTEAFGYSVSNLLKMNGKPQIAIKNHFHSYLSQIKQKKLVVFTKSASRKSTEESRVFFISSLWPHPNCITGTNFYRKMFIESCLKNNTDFEGGFWVTDRNHPQFTEFKHLTFNKRYFLGDYIAKTQKSMIVFNTPAVHNCHGWKLGQFLAMGKAIISTPFQNALPEDLMHGKNIHFVHDETEMDIAVERLLQDNDYRKKLEQGAKEYYDKFGAPISVISQIIQQLKIRC